MRKSEEHKKRGRHNTVLFFVLFVSYCSPAIADNAAGVTNNWTSGIPIATAILAAVAAYMFNSRIEKKRLELKLVNDQLQYLYGPLLSLNYASNQAWNTFRESCRPGGSFFRKDDPPKRAEIEEWRHWMNAVFMPINLQSEGIILNNIHLIEGAVVPESFLQFLSHVASYKAVTSKWATEAIPSKFSFEDCVAKNTAALNYPEEFQNEVSKVFHMLKARQTTLAASFGR